MKCARLDNLTVAKRFAEVKLAPWKVHSGTAEL